MDGPYLFSHSVMVVSIVSPMFVSLFARRIFISTFLLPSVTNSAGEIPKHGISDWKALDILDFNWCCQPVFKGAVWLTIPWTVCFPKALPTLCHQLFSSIWQMKQWCPIVVLMGLNSEQCVSLTYVLSPLSFSPADCSRPWPVVQLGFFSCYDQIIRGEFLLWLSGISGISTVPRHRFDP